MHIAAAFSPFVFDVRWLLAIEEIWMLLSLLLGYMFVSKGLVPKSRGRIGGVIRVCSDMSKQRNHQCHIINTKPNVHKQIEFSTIIVFLPSISSFSNSPIVPLLLQTAI